MKSQHWSFALSTDEGKILFYRSNLPGDSEKGHDHGEDIDEESPMWEAVEESNVVAAAWARCFTTGEPQEVECHAKRNQRKFTLRMWRIDRGDYAVITHGEWHHEHDPLTETEIQTCQMLTKGESIANIASRLEISEQSVKRYRQSAMNKLGVTTYEQLGARFC